MPSETVGVVPVTAFGGKECQVPILDHIPPERVEGVDETDDESVGC